MNSLRDNTRLGKELEELERTDPAVGEAAQRLDDTIQSILYRINLPKTRFHKSTPDHPCQPYKSPPS